MKNKYIFTLVLLLSLLGFSSCDFLDEYDPNSTTDRNYYASESDILHSLDGVYASLTQTYVTRDQYLFTDIRANATVVTNSGANSGIPYQFYNYTLTEENSYVAHRYAQFFNIISRGNTLLYHLNDVTYSSENTKNIIEAQIRFIRAFAYFHLVTEWGDVPIVLTYLKNPAEIYAHNHRCPKVDVYKVIFDDLQFVTESSLPDVQPASQSGRAGKNAAWALWGKALLHYALDDDFASEKTQMLSAAIEKLTKVWNLRSFGELAEIHYNTLWDLSTQKGCPEHIFQINYIQGNADLSSDWNYVYGPVETGVTSMHFGEGLNVTTPEVYDSYESGDVRKAYLRKMTLAGKDYYHTMKYVDLECGPNGYGGNNMIVLRYADVVLMLAEAHYWNGNEVEARSWLNKVRKRAGLSDWMGTDLRQGIYDERLHEFMQEGHRWHDVLRMYSDDEMIAHFSAINPNFSVKDLLLPIPYNERVLNPEGLYQNPGYGVK